MNFSCFDIVKMAASGIDGLHRNAWKERILMRNCNAIDGFAIEADATGYGILIDEDTGHIVVSVECPGVYSTEKDSGFFDVLNSSISVSIECVDGDMLKIGFEIDGMWSE